MKLTVSTLASNPQATITVDGQTYTGACVKQSSGGYCVSLKNVPNAPQKWVSVPGMKGEIVDKTFDREIDGNKPSDKAKATPSKAQTKLTMSVFLEQTIAACASSEELDDADVEAITNAIQPILDKIKKSDEKRQAEQAVAAAQAALDAALANLAKLSE